jgi:hypothetical protein
VGNFGADLKDSEVYSVLLHQLDASRCPLVKIFLAFCGACCVTCVTKLHELKLLISFFCGGHFFIFIRGHLPHGLD